jgi:uncharacterized membrane protein YeiH
MAVIPDPLTPLEQAPVLLPMLFDYSATFIWALSGALIAARRGLVGIGVFTVALVSATGGGLLRDGLLLSTTPSVLHTPFYVALAFGATLLVLLFGGSVDRSKYLPPAIHFVDALGAGTYAVVGVDRALAAGLPLVGVILVGMVNATGGGVLRDVLMRRVPELFRPGLPIGFASLVGAGLFALLVMQFGVRTERAAFITIAIVLVFNMIMLRLHIRNKPLEAFRKYWDGTTR